MYNYPQKALGWFLDTVFPKICVGCGKLTNKDDFDYVCRKCFGGLELKNGLECIGCKRETRLGLTCAFCAKESHVNQLIIVAELSDPVIDKMLKTYKYKFIYKMTEPLSAIANKCVKKLVSRNFSLFEDDSLLIPVPLHQRRLNWRGFNQAQLIAKSLSDTFLISVCGSVLTRTVNSKNQADIKTRKERLNNVKGSFAVNDPELIKDKTIILVDDICTTGATLNECARVLKESGAKRVIGFVIARG